MTIRSGPRHLVALDEANGEVVADSFGAAAGCQVEHSLEGEFRPACKGERCGVEPDSGGVEPLLPVRGGPYVLG